MSEIILPTQIVKASTKSPKNLILIAKPKVGKTSLLSKLDNCLLLDLEGGSDYVDALKIKASSVKEIKEIGVKIKEAGKPYEYIAVDTITALEDMCIPYAEELYSKSPGGKNWFTDGKIKYGSIINLPNGSGYNWLREAFFKVIEYIKTWAPKVILVGHIKDVLLEKEGSEINSVELDLTGKLKRISTSQSDAIGYLYRKGNKNMISFKTSDTVACGARPEHLCNQEFVISEINENGEYITHWDKVYID
jgi:hypothetical protein